MALSDRQLAGIRSRHGECGHPVRLPFVAGELVAQDSMPVLPAPWKSGRCFTLAKRDRRPIGKFAGGDTLTLLLPMEGFIFTPPKAWNDSPSLTTLLFSFEQIAYLGQQCFAWGRWGRDLLVQLHLCQCTEDKVDRSGNDQKIDGIVDQ